MLPQPQIKFDRSWYDPFMHNIEQDGPWADWQLFQLAYTSEQQLTVPDFQGLVTPQHLPNLNLLPHQKETAETVIEQMHGKAILADEVGLGKTIEAGLIMKEYMIRGLAKKILILVPASLVLQWTKELNEKFYIPAIPQRKSYMWDQCDVVISSIDTAKRPNHADVILQQNYDLVIIDEAHKLKNHQTKNYHFVKKIKKKFCLLLTATPVQNRLSELYYLVTLLKPGYLGDADSFFKDYRSGKNKVKNEEKLRGLINRIMVRNRRSNTEIDWSKRHVEAIDIPLTPEERKLYNSLQALKNTDVSLSLITLQREACSSREALYMTIKKMSASANNPVIQHILQAIIDNIQAVTTNSKANKVLELVQKIDDKVIIFTEYRATQLYLQWFLQQYEITAVPFHGGFKRSKKDWMRTLFQNDAQVLIATEAGGEGINLQFCHHVINYDLPWNPMRIEQRIGRVHRLGQEHDVHIYNFATKHTIEEHILHLLYEKIDLFENVIGKLDDILNRLELENIDQEITEIFETSDSEGELRIKIDNLTSILNTEYIEQKGENA